MFEIRKVNDLTPHPLHDSYISLNTPRALLSLETSIESNGILYPLTINQKNEIIDGTSRWRIAVKLKIEEVAVLIVDPNSEQELLLTLNESRRDNESDPIRMALRIRKLYDLLSIRRGRKTGHSDQKDTGYIANLLKLNQRKINRLLKLLQLITPIQAMVSQGKIGIIVGNQIASRLNLGQQETLSEVINKLESNALIKNKEARLLIQQIQEGLISEETINCNSNITQFENLEHAIEMSAGINHQEVTDNITEARVDKVLADITKIHQEIVLCYEKMGSEINMKLHRNLKKAVNLLMGFLMEREDGTNE